MLNFIKQDNEKRHIKKPSERLGLKNFGTVFLVVD
jgi:hypothetical protein